MGNLSSDKFLKGLEFGRKYVFEKDDLKKEYLYVYYKRGLTQSTSNISGLIKTANVKKNTKNFIGSGVENSPKKSDIIKTLTSLAAKERAKEEKILRDLDPNKHARYSQMGDAKFINKLNEFLGMGEKYKIYLQYLNEIYPTTSAKNMSPMVTSYFNNYFASILTSDEFFNILSRKIMQIVKNNGTAADIDRACEEVGEWIKQKFMEDSGNNSFFEKFMEKVEGTNTKQLEEQYHFWKELFEKIKSDESIRNEFMESVMRSFGLTNTVKNAVNAIKKQQEGKATITKQMKKKAIKSAVNSRSAAKGGLYYEGVQAALAAFNLKELGKTVWSTSRISDSGTTDMVSLYTGKISLSIQDEITQRFNELIEKPAKDKAVAVENVREFTKWVNDHVDKGVLIYTNAKSYKQSRLITGESFFQGGRRNIKHLDSVINSTKGAKLNSDAVNGLINIVINTIPGAIYEGSTRAQEILSRFLAQKIAYMLFDDWDTIGGKQIDDLDENVKAIHVFALNGILVPLSYLLTKASEAFRATSIDFTIKRNEYFRVSFETPNNILFPEAKNTTDWMMEQIYDKYGKKEYNQLDYKDKFEIRAQQLIEAWNKQSADAINNTTFGIDFLSNFNDLLQELNQFR